MSFDFGSDDLFSVFEKKKQAQHIRFPDADSETLVDKDDEEEVDTALSLRQNHQHQEEADGKEIVDLVSDSESEIKQDADDNNQENISEPVKTESTESPPSNNNTDQVRDPDKLSASREPSSVCTSDEEFYLGKFVDGSCQTDAPDIRATSVQTSKSAKGSGADDVESVQELLEKLGVSDYFIFLLHEVAPEVRSFPVKIDRLIKSYRELKDTNERLRNQLKTLLQRSADLAANKDLQRPSSQPLHDRSRQLASPAMSLASSDEDVAIAGSTDLSFTLDTTAEFRYNEDEKSPRDRRRSHIAYTASDLCLSDANEAKSEPQKRHGPVCFNCGGGHVMRECKEKIDMARVRDARSTFDRSRPPKVAGSGDSRYHLNDDASEFENLKPGVISEDLRDALDISKDELPPWIYMMRRIGYPPGHLIAAQREQSGLKMIGIDEKDALHDGTDDVEYDPDLIIDYPGFNVEASPGTVDLGYRLDAPYMMPEHRKDYFQQRIREQNARVQSRRQGSLAAKKALEPAVQPTTPSRPRARRMSSQEMDISDSEEREEGEYVEDVSPPPPCELSLPPPPPPPTMPPPVFENLSLEALQAQKARLLADLNDSPSSPILPCDAPASPSGSSRYTSEQPASPLREIPLHNNGAENIPPPREIPLIEVEHDAPASPPADEQAQVECAKVVPLDAVVQTGTLIGAKRVFAAGDATEPQTKKPALDSFGKGIQDIVVSEPVAPDPIRRRNMSKLLGRIRSAMSRKDDEVA